MLRKSADIIIIGAGPAGMAAALKASELGVKRILLADRLPEMGGILQQCIHNGFGLQVFEKDWTGPEYADHYIKRIGKTNIEVMLRTMAVEITGEGRVILSNDSYGLIEVDAKARILAMGCRERTRQQAGVPGTRPSGIFTAGVAQRFVNVEGYMPGKEVVVVGSGDIGLIMARRMTLEGAKVRAVTEILPHPSGLNRNIVQCLHDYNIPLYLNHGVLEIFGKDRVEGVKIKGPKKAFEIECDTVLFSVGLIPENELSRMVPLDINPATGGPYIDDAYETTREGTFICGNAAFVNDLADYASIEGEIAGEGAAAHVSSAIRRAPGIETVAGENLRFVVPNFITREDPVTLYMRVTEPLLDATLVSTGNVVRKKYRIVKPGEMMEVKLDTEQLKKVKSLKELRFDVKKN